MPDQPTTITVNGKTYAIDGIYEYPATETKPAHTDVRYFTGKRWMLRRLKATDVLA